MFANTTLPDLLDVLERSSGRDLSDWAARWLRTTGVNTLSVRTELDGSHYRSVHIGQTGAGTDAVLRPHRIAIGLYDRRGAVLERRDRIEVDVDGPLTEVPSLVGVRVADLLLVNDDDLTFAKIRLDEHSQSTLLTDAARLADPLARALCYSALHDMLRDAELGAGSYLRAVTPAFAAESQVGVLEDLGRHAVAAAEMFGRPEHREARLAELADETLRLARAAPDADRRLALVRIAVRAATTPPQGAVLAEWLAGEGVPAGLVVDAEFRWAVLERLAVLGAADDGAIDAELARDDTATGRASAAACRAAAPTEHAKAAAWASLVDTDELSNRLVQRTAAAFWQRPQADLCRPYVARYVADIVDLWRERSPNTAKDLAVLLFPAQAVEPATAAAVDVLLDAEDLPAGLQRVLIEGRADLARTLAARDADD